MEISNRINYWLDSYVNKSIEPVIHKITEDLSEYLNKNERRGSTNRTKRYKAVACFVCNTIRALNKNQDTVYISLNRNNFSTILNGRKTPLVSYSYTRAAMDMFSVKGWIDLDIGGVDSWKLDGSGNWIPDESHFSSYKILEPLQRILFPYLKHENKLWLLNNVLYLRDKDSNLVEFPNNNKVKKMISRINAINKAAKSATFTYRGEDMPDVQFKRIFNEDFNKGGRFYADGGTIQCWNQQDRLDIQIDGEPVVEMDFGCFHPRMLYAIEGIELEEGFDPYYVEWGSEYDPKEVRNFVKRALLIMINAEHEEGARGAIGKLIADETKAAKKAAEEDRQYIKKYGSIKSPVKITQLMDELSMRNQAIEYYFNSGHGIILQNLDSQIAEYVLDHFAVQGEAAVSVHDSFIVKESLKEELVSVMKEAYEHVVGNSFNCIVEEK